MKDNSLALIEKLHKAQKSNKSKDILNAQLELSKYYFSTQNYQKARRILLEIKKQENTYFGINYALGLIELEEENLDLAQKYFKEELKANPDHIQAKELIEKLEINSNFPYVTLLLIFFCSLSFYLFFNNSLEYFLNFSISIHNSSFFSIITSIFFHSSLFHLITNMLILFMFGLILEKNIGSFLFLIIFLFGGFLGNTAELIFATNDVFVIGASGGIFAIFGALLMRQPLLNLKLLGLIKIPLIIVLGFIISLSFFISNFLLEKNINSGDISHMVGFLFGVLVIGILFNNTLSNFYNWIFISVGFYLIFDVLFNFIIQNEIFLEIITIGFLIGIFMELLKLILGIILIVFSYKQIKQRFFEVLENE